MIKEVNKSTSQEKYLGSIIVLSGVPEKRKHLRTQGVVVQPILTKEFASRGQVDLIDMQSMAQNSDQVCCPSNF